MKLRQPLFVTLQPQPASPSTNANPMSCLVIRAEDQRKSAEFYGTDGTRTLRTRFAVWRHRAPAASRLAGQTAAGCSTVWALVSLDNGADVMCDNRSVSQSPRRRECASQSCVTAEFVRIIMKRRPAIRHRTITTRRHGHPSYCICSLPRSVRITPSSPSRRLCFFLSLRVFSVCQRDNSNICGRILMIFLDGRDV